MKTHIKHFIAHFVVSALLIILICMFFSDSGFGINSFVDCIKEYFNIGHKCSVDTDNNNNLEICVHCEKGFNRSKEFRNNQDTDPDFAKYRNYCQKCFRSTAKLEKEIYEDIVASYERILGEPLR